MAKDQPLKDLHLKLECRSLNEIGRRIPDPTLCKKIDLWLKLEQANGQLADATDESEDKSPNSLEVEIESQMQTKDPSGFETTFNIGTLGFYPTQTDRWFKTKISIYDQNGRLLETGQFKAMIRTYFGWGYFFYARLLGLSQKPRPYLATLENSKDFYAYFGELLRNAQRSRVVDTPAAGGGNSP